MFRKCEKCGANHVGYNWIRKHVRGVMKVGNDPRTATGRQNTLNQVKGLHKDFNESKPPLYCCISTYSKIITDAIDSYKKQN